MAMMEFYTTLYAKDEEVDANSIARGRCLYSVPSIVTKDQNRQLTRDITLEEIKKAIEMLSTHKALGEDRLPTEFYQEFIELTGPTLAALAIETKETGSLRPSIK